MHQTYMNRAIVLARKGIGHVNPNPLVGAVLVKDGRIIGEGYHARYGEAHAERNALMHCVQDPAGSTLYVTLEPCCHHGKTPPCTDAILEAGITSVVIGTLDPNPKVAGGGASILQNAGIAVKTGVLEAECRKLNAVFFHYIKTGLPYVVAKYAMSADGRLSGPPERSKRLTGDLAWQSVHARRNALSAIMVGIETILSDDPLLTCRLPEGRSPIRIVCDSHLRIPPAARILQTARDTPTLIIASYPHPTKQAALTAAGAEIVFVPAKDGHIDLATCMQILGKRGIDSILLEGGATLHASAFAADIVQELELYVAPMLFGTGGGKTAISGFLPQEKHLSLQSVTSMGEDVRLCYTVEK